MYYILGFIYADGYIRLKDYRLEFHLKKTDRNLLSRILSENVLGIKHHDLVEYTFKNGETHQGYVTALYPELNALNFQSKTKHCKKVNAKKCKLLWKFNKIYQKENTPTSKLRGSR